MKLKKLIVAVAPRAARTIGLPNTQRTPAATCPFPAASVGGSRRRRGGARAPRRRTKRRRRRASTGAESACTSSAADARPGDVRERPAAVHDRVALDEALAGHERDEQRAVRDVEEHAQRPHQERDDEHVRDRQRVERVGERERGDQERAADVGRDHRLPPAAAAVDPGAGVEREEEVRRELGRDEVAHLGRVRVEHEHGDERQRDQADLVADERDGLPEPEAPEARFSRRRGGTSMAAHSNLARCRPCSH